MPPYLAGREAETREFARLTAQDPVLENLVLTGLRGVGKTVLLETLKPLAMQSGWLWVGTDLSESASLTEESIALRLLTDLSVATSALVVGRKEFQTIGFHRAASTVEHTLGFQTLQQIYAQTPGLVADKLKRTLELVWLVLDRHQRRGLVFAYDEAQNLADHADREQYPLSLLLDVFQSLQRRDVRFMLALTGLPTLFPKMVEARTFAERMSRVVFLNRLDEQASREAILKPIRDASAPLMLDDESVQTIVRMSAGYPYFIQFICREVYDVFIEKLAAGQQPRIPVDEITRKLDSDFFAGRWARATDRQRELLTVIARLPNCDAEFTVQEMVEMSKRHLRKGFSSSHANQMLGTLSDAGLVYKNRHGRYSFAVPLMGQFILRQNAGGPA